MIKVNHLGLNPDDSGSSSTSVNALRDNIVYVFHQCYGARLHTSRCGACPEAAACAAEP